MVRRFLTPHATMNTHRPIVRLFALLATSAGIHAQTESPNSPSTSEETITLPAFTVSSDRTNPYRATDSLSAARIRGSLMDTPATVNVITNDFLKDIGAASLYDATQYVSGIGNGRLAGGSGILDRQTIRGYENDGRTIDNFNSSFQANLDPLLYERVEIVKGPNAILAPTGTPGGSINVITKSPQFTRENSATLELARFFGNKLTIDSTGAIADSKRFAYRLLAGYQDADSNVDGSIRTYSINPQFTWRISERSELTIKTNFVQWGTYGGAQNPSITLHASPALANGATIGLDTIAPGFVYGEVNGSSADWVERTDRLQRITAQFTTALTDRISMRLAAMQHYDHFYTDFTGLSTPGQTTQSSRYNPYTGIYTPEQTWAKDATGNYVPTFSAQYDPTSIVRTAGYEHAWNEDLQLQNDYAGNFQLGPVSHSGRRRRLVSENRHRCPFWQRRARPDSQSKPRRARQFSGTPDQLHPRRPPPHREHQETDLRVRAVRFFQGPRFCQWRRVPSLARCAGHQQTQQHADTPGGLDRHTALRCPRQDHAGCLRLLQSFDQREWRALRQRGALPRGRAGRVRHQDRVLPAAALDLRCVLRDFPEQHRYAEPELLPRSAQQPAVLPGRSHQRRL